MKSNKHRLAVLAFAVAGSVLLEGCASVTTGQFTPSRSVNTNRSMTTRYDQFSHQLKTPSTGVAVQDRVVGRRRHARLSVLLNTGRPAARS